MDPYTAKYNPNTIIEAANAKLTQSNDWEGGQLLFQSALLTWSDDARELKSASSTGRVPEELREAVATLWIAYAHYLASAKQFKSATEAYEQAVSDPTASTVGRVWLDYAAFCVERSKFRLAQDVYLRALVHGSNNGAVQEEQDRDVLWQSFLEMMQQQRDNPDLTLEELQQAVMTAPDNENTTSSMDMEEEDDEGNMKSSSSPLEPLRKKIKMESSLDDTDAATQSAPAAALQKKVHVVIEESVESAAASFLQLLQQPDMPAEIRAAWMIRDGPSPSQPPEPPLFEATPPKLYDPSGKDILGASLALELTQRLLSSPSGGLLLQVCRALWVMSALEHSESSKQLQRLDQEMLAALAAHEEDYASRRSVAGDAQAVEAAIAQERQAFQAQCATSRRDALQSAAWQARRLLCAQQLILQQFNVPAFESGPTVDSATLAWQAVVTKFLHSAFYLRSRIGTAPHQAMLQSQVTRLQKVVESEAEQQQQQPQLQQQYQDDYSNNNNNSNNEGPTGGGGYYNQPPPPPPPPPLPQGYNNSNNKNNPPLPPPPPPHLMPPGVYAGHNNNNLPPPPPPPPPSLQQQPQQPYGAPHGYPYYHPHR